jgi:hypothetical protein
MIVLAKTHFDTTNDDAHYHAFEYLDAAERLCSDYGFFVGYRGISAAYYTFGAAFVKLDLVSKAVYPLRKSCTVLELVSEQVSVDADKLQLVKRYEVLGTCFTKDGDSKVNQRGSEKEKVSMVIISLYSDLILTLLCFFTECGESLSDGPEIYPCNDFPLAHRGI